MKKTLIALAALAAGTAFAQSTVTISGGVAAGIKYTPAKSVDGSVSTNTIDRFGAADNNITFNVVEDLGGGLKAGAVVQVRFDPSNGRNRGTATLDAGQSPFAQNVKLSLNGGFGEVAAGRFNGPVDLMRGPVDFFGGADHAYFAPDDAVTRYNGMIAYNTPVFSGFKAGIATALKSNTTGAAVNMSELAATYTNGPVYVGLGFTNNAGKTAAGVAVDGKDVVTLVGSYDFGVVKLGGTYSQVRASTKAEAAGEVDSKRYNLAVTAPVTNEVSVRASFENYNAEVDSKDYKYFALGGDYKLSKRTKFIADLFKKNSDNKALDDKNVGVFVGLKHTF